MNEDQLERKLTHLMQQLDAKLSSGRITRKDYNKEVKKIKKQAEHYRMQNSKGMNINAPSFCIFPKCTNGDLSYKAYKNCKMCIIDIAK